MQDGSCIRVRRSAANCTAELNLTTLAIGEEGRGRISGRSRARVRVRVRVRVGD